MRRDFAPRSPGRATSAFAAGGGERRARRRWRPGWGTSSVALPYHDGAWPNTRRWNRVAVKMITNSTMPTADA